MRRPAIVTVTTAALVLAPLAAGATSDPPDPDATQPDDATPGASTNLERQLAEFAFVDFLLVDVEVVPLSYACSEPDSLDEPSPITCFAVTGIDDVTGNNDVTGNDDGDDRDAHRELVVATTTSSRGTGRFEFEIVEAAPPPTEPTEPPEPTADPRATAAADAAVLAHGDLINDNADAFIDAYLQDDQIAAIDGYEFDPVLMMLTLDITLAPGVSFTAEDLAWGNTGELARQHWAQGQPFRNDAAELRPGFTIIVDRQRYVSDHSLMAQVADGRITRDQWVTIAERPDE